MGIPKKAIYLGTLMNLVDVKTTDPRRRIQITVGEYDKETRTFTKKVSPRHKLRLFDGYGIQEKVLIGLHEQMDCLWVRVVEENGDSYLDSIQHWMNGKTLDFGHGPQKFLTTQNLTPEIHKGDFNGR